MKLLYLTDRLSILGGADHHLHQVIRWSIKNQWQTTVAYGRIEGEAPVFEHCTLTQVRGLANSIGSPSRLGALDELLKNHDLVHIQNVMNPVALTRAVRTGRALVTVQDHRFFCPGQGKTMPDGNRCFDTPTDAVCRACLEDVAYRARLLELTTERCEALRKARVTVLSSYMADELRLLGIDRIEVIPPWVESSDCKVDAGQGFVTGGRLVRHKASIDSWRAWRRSKTDHPLLVAGRGPLETEFTGAERLGWLSQDDLMNVLHQARALLFPSSWQEPFGILGVQSLAAGTPVIVADSGGTGEWAKEGCLHFQPGNIEQMAAAITELAENPEQARRLGETGRGFVDERFNRERIEKRLRDIYAKVLL